MAVLITGGTGYIGSHTCVELLNVGYEIVMLDNFSNSNPAVLNRIYEITGKLPKFYEIDILDKVALEKVFRENDIHAVIHFAGLKAVGESVEEPLKYYHNNIIGSLILFDVMRAFRVKKIVFSSSASVYGMPNTVPITEDLPLNPTNPYGRTKLMIEMILRDLYLSDKNWSIALLRYFNPIGAHESGKLGENPNGIPNNLMPYITQVAVGKRDKLNIFGGDYDTHDGTGVRDYIHIVDLATGHLKALDKVLNSTGIESYNLGTGVGYSVLDIVKCFEKVIGREIPYIIAARRSGDVDKSYADTSKAERLLNWKAVKSLQDMCEDSWRWQKNNPQGY